MDKKLKLKSIEIKIVQNIFIYSLLFILCFLFFACENPFVNKLLHEDNNNDNNLNGTDTPYVPVANITCIPVSMTANIPLELTGTVTPSNASNKNISWSVKNAGNTGTVITDNTFFATAAGTAIITATIADGIAPGIAYTQDFTITVMENNETSAGTIILSIDDFTPVDTGAGIFNIQPVIISKNINPTAIISAGGLEVIAWHIGNLFIGTGSSLILNAANLGTGNFILYCTFMMDNKPWMGSISFTVTE